MHMICMLVMFEMGRYTLGMGGADDVLWSSVVSLRWRKGYIERCYCSCFYEMTKHIIKSAFVCKYVYTCKVHM